jgi:hypothetical protein
LVFNLDWEDQKPKKAVVPITASPHQLAEVLTSAAHLSRAPPPKAAVCSFGYFPLDRSLHWFYTIDHSLNNTFTHRIPRESQLVDPLLQCRSLLPDHNSPTGGSIHPSNTCSAYSQALHCELHCDELDLV